MPLRPLGHLSVMKRTLGGSFRTPAKGSVGQSLPSPTRIQKGPWAGPLEPPRRAPSGKACRRPRVFKKDPGRVSFRTPATGSVKQSLPSPTRIQKGPWEGPLEPPRRVPLGKARRHSRVFYSLIGERREWESNPRYLSVNLISNQAPSATRPSLPMISIGYTIKLFPDVSVVPWSCPNDVSRPAERQHMP